MRAAAEAMATYAAWHGGTGDTFPDSRTADAILEAVATEPVVLGGRWCRLARAAAELRERREDGA